jgi:hypothetical protein
MVKRYLRVLALTSLYGASVCVAGGAHAVAPKAEVDRFPAWRAAAAQVLAARGDAESLATAAALTFLGPPSRSRTETGKAAAAALDYAVKASELAPDNAAILWLRLRLCTNAPGCDIREAATTMRWVDADNGAAWLPTLAAAQRDRDSTEIDRVLNDMAEGTRFDVYLERAAVLMFDALKQVRDALPKHYTDSDVARLDEAIGIANAAMIPSFSALINACAEAVSTERREACVRLSKTLQRADAIMAQLVGFAMERRLMPTDPKELRTIAERRHLLEWRAAAANQADAPVLPWTKNAHARWRLAAMRTSPREEDVCIAILREHKMPLEPPEEHP